MLQSIGIPVLPTQVEKGCGSLPITASLNMLPSAVFVVHFELIGARFKGFYFLIKESVLTHLCKILGSRLFDFIDAAFSPNKTQIIGSDQRQRLTSFNRAFFRSDDRAFDNARSFVMHFYSRYLLNRILVYMATLPTPIVSRFAGLEFHDIPASKDCFVRKLSKSDGE